MALDFSELIWLALFEGEIMLRWDCDLFSCWDLGLERITDLLSLKALFKSGLLGDFWFLLFLI